MEDVEGRVAFVTGGSSGIGRGIALAFARAGMRVVISGRRQEHVDESLAEFAAAGLDVEAVLLDVTDRDAVERAAEDTERRFGRVDVLVNNAGIGLTGPIMAATPADWDWLLDVNVKGVGHGICAFVPRIQAHGEGGHVVNTASMAGLLPIVAGLYSMTKAAVIALSEALAIELAPDGIGVSAYCPGPVHSNIAGAVARRPERYGESGYALPPAAFLERARTQPYMSYAEAGERVLHGVRRNDLFILTHPEFRDGVRDRFETTLAAFPDEPVDEVRAAAIPFLTSHTAYAPEKRNPSPRSTPR
ncbi:SDR family NAD(P)-dependent oxidoreductase [Geodermatophilus sp. TF02-6]|uniref:SDR family NAD(P)-dependent oxidoreductase n=1 Tax=Geodermatophilus sp. TF02-6 TaxID=2250575 RepID=UPI000DEB53C7|nr:SDR family NAD(P)-dependent oxidoreductase [Geodermatophilus sp. TF02-6]RBY82410.1 SDR family NAD(P)-dependent oxidoreductase [Geodermatophilus sp. TF02-6]